MKFKSFEQSEKDEGLLKYQSDDGLRFAELREHKEEERIPREFAVQKMQSAEHKIAELGEETKQWLDGIEQSVGLPAEAILAVRKEVGLSGRLGKIGDEANHLLGRLKGKVSGFLAREKNSDTTTTEKSETSNGPEYKELKDYLKREQREINRPVIEEAKKRRNQLLESRGVLSMSKDDFDDYFSSNEFEVRAELEQQNVGDCYAVAAIHAMSRSPHFEIICRSSMKRLPDGSWQVRIPLMSKDGQMITITPEELLPQKNSQFFKRKEKGEIMPDLRRKLRPVKGKEGLQVLEAAFIKQKFGSVDRLASEGGWPEEVLLSLGGDNFKEYSINSATWNPEKEKWEYLGLGSLNEKNMAYLDHYLENFDPEVHIATASTKHVGAEAVPFYRAKGTMTKFLLAGHAYSISDVDAEKKMINLANPWDTSKPMQLTFEQFKENFSGFNAIRIDSAKLLSSMRHVEKKKDLN